MGKIQENLPHGSSRNKIEYLAEKLDTFQAPYPLNRTAFMEFLIKKEDLDEKGNIQYLRAPLYTSIFSNDLFQCKGSSFDYFGVGLAANAITNEEVKALGDGHGNVPNRTQEIINELNLSDKDTGVIWVDTVMTGRVGNFYIALKENEQPVTIPAPDGDDLNFYKDEDGEVFYVKMSLMGDEIYSNPDLPPASKALELAVQSSSDSSNDVETERFNACVFHFMMDFKLKVTFPKSTSAPTANKINIRFEQAFSSPNIHAFEYFWDDSDKTLEVNGVMIVSQIYINDRLFGHNSDEFFKNGALPLELECDDLAFNSAESFVMSGSIAVTGAQPCYQDPRL